MKRKITVSGGLILLFSFFSYNVFTQDQTNREQLQKIASEQSVIAAIQKAEAISYAKAKGIPVSFTTPDGQFAEIQFIDPFGNPQYYITNNANSAATISTSQVFAGGSAGLNLSGAGITARVWDGGAVRTSHQEFGGRAVQADAATTLNYHSTHVSGTLIASGVVSSAKGMAPAAQLRAFDWNSDVSEMATEASNGALQSSHSYGYVRGWYYNGATWTWYGNTSISTQEDYQFGFYDSQAQQWDNIARNAPNFLICKSSGNDRGEGPVGGPYPLDGPYDCIGHAGVAKNILTVGAVYDIPGGYTDPSSVVMTPFSGWGPADDGRIKPDIVANGVSLYSTDKDSNTDYTSLLGTSMSTPSVSGSLLLLQEHWNNLHPGEYMKSATLKALVLHTADECGTSNGPDYKYGWGLMNTKKAALKISEDQDLNVIEELVLSNGETYTRQVQSDGTEPIKVTICWTDPAGTPVSAQLDPLNPMLVNDLDLRVINGTTYHPWKLDRNNPSNPATNNGENNVDNVEMVFIASPAAGTYTITVDHDGTLAGGSQAFSIVISGIVSSSLPPVANFTVSDQTPFIGEPVTFTDLSTNAPTGWLWAFTPSTVSFLNGTSATTRHPQVTFDATGSYTVSLTVTNAFGSDTRTEVNYINAVAAPPSCVSPVSPVAGATGISISTSLNWGAASGASGYYLFLGTNNPPTNLINGLNVGNVTSYTPSLLSYNTTYYWQVIPYNANGQPTGCLVWSFTTMANPNFPYTESFETGFGQWVNVTYDNFNWTRRSGAPPTAKTGPKKAYQGSYYIYTESDGAQQNWEACLEASFNFTGIPNPEISFWYFMYGNQMGSLYVDVFANGAWTNLWYRTGQQQISNTRPWLNAVIPLNAYGNQTGIILRFRAKRGSGIRSDIAVDYVSVRQQGTTNPGGGKPPKLISVGNSPNNPAIQESDIELYSYDKAVYIRNLSNAGLDGNVEIYNLTGQLVGAYHIGGTGDFRLTSGLLPGLYIVRMVANNQIISKKVIIN